MLGWCRCQWIQCWQWCVYVVVIVELQLGCEINWFLFYFFKQPLSVSRSWANSIFWCCHPSYLGRLRWFCGCQMVILNQNWYGHISHVFNNIVWGWGGNFWYISIRGCQCGLLLYYVLLCPVFLFIYYWCCCYWVSIGYCWLFQWFFEARWVGRMRNFLLSSYKHLYVLQGCVGFRYQ